MKKLLGNFLTLFIFLGFIGIGVNSTTTTTLSATTLITTTTLLINVVGTTNLTVEETMNTTISGITQTTGATRTLTVNLKNTGNATAYYVNTSITLPTGWTSDSRLYYGNISKQTNITNFTTVNIPAGTTAGGYTITLLSKWSNPDGTLGQKTKYISVAISTKTTTLPEFTIIEDQITGVVPQNTSKNIGAFNITASGNDNILSITVDTDGSGDLNASWLTFNPSSISSVSADSNRSIDVTVSIPESQPAKTYLTYGRVTTANAGSDTILISVTVQSFNFSTTSTTTSTTTTLPINDPDLIISFDGIRDFDLDNTDNVNFNVSVTNSGNKTIYGVNLTSINNTSPGTLTIPSECYSANKQVDPSQKVVLCNITFKSSESGESRITVLVKGSYDNKTITYEKSATITIDPKSTSTTILINNGCVVPTDGMIINGTVTFCKETYNLPHGIKINVASSKIDCNDSIIKGLNFTDVIQTGFDILSINDVTIKNCIIKDYYWGINAAESNGNVYLNNIFENNSWGLVLSQYETKHNIVFNNTFIGNDGKTPSGLIGYAASFNSIINNSFLNCSWLNLFYREDTNGPSVSNEIYGNVFETCGLSGDSLKYNTYCVNGIGNTYLNGATGPTCPESNLEQRLTILEQIVQTLQNAICTVHSFNFCGEKPTTTTTTISVTTTTIHSTTTTTLQTECDQKCEQWYNKDGLCRNSCLGGERYNGLSGCQNGQRCCCG